MTPTDAPPRSPSCAAEPPRSPWISSAWFTPSGGLVAEATAGVVPATVFERLARRRHVLFLDSALTETAAGDDATAQTAEPAGRPLGRYSFVTADPIHSIEVEPPQTEPAAEMAGRLSDACRQLRSMLADLACPTIPGLPPFQGGIAGLVSYEAGLAHLGLAAPPASSATVPLLSLHVYDVVFAFDHELNRGWFISQGLPARGPAARRDRASERLTALLDESAPAAPSTVTDAAPPAAGHPLPARPGVRSTHSRDHYLAMVRAGIEFVKAGDIFQVNLAQRFSVVADVDPVEVYRRARQINPAPCAGFFAAGGTTIASMSPERLLQVSHGTARMHPIKGTRRMLSSPEADLYAADDLGDSAKDRAENVMIVDLVRNDLARVCRPESVRVESLCRLERYRYVQHLVSIVAGRLRAGLGPLDALEAAIPGGSVTGAPKHRACEIISQLEGFRRGGYCGSLGYLGFDGSADWNLLIRTFVIARGEISFAAGGGITAASVPEDEYAESLHKAEGMLRVLDALGIAGGTGG